MRIHRPSKLLLVILCVLAGMAGYGSGHNLSYGVATVEALGESQYQISVSFHIASYVLGGEAGHLSFDRWQWLKRMPEDELEAHLQLSRESFLDQLEIFFDGRPFAAQSLTFPSSHLVRQDGLAEWASQAPPVVIQGAIPAGAKSFRIRFPRRVGAVLIEHRLYKAPQLSLLDPAKLSDSAPVEALSFSGSKEATSLRVFSFFGLGFLHILPRGLDHVLFVLSLFFLCRRLKPLLWQISAFTAAHSLTLALAMSGFVSVPAGVVEPLIAASIVIVALENLFVQRLHLWRPFLVFGFGLLHGLGFASVLSTIPSSSGAKLLALLSFNAGVEAGQIAVLLGAFLLVGWARNRDWYLFGIARPASLAIAGIAFYWTLERLTQFS